MSENIKKNQDIKVNDDEEKIKPSKEKTIRKVKSTYKKLMNLSIMIDFL